jgi:hypothetical protein
MRTLRRAFRASALAAVAACGPATPDDRATAARTVSYAGVVDSAVPRDEALRRFRTGLAEPRELDGAAASRDALVRAFVRAVEAGDSGALRALVLTRAEFGWLYYPTTPQGLPPYDLSPSLLWFLTDGATSQGVRRLLEERAERPLGYAGYRCDPTPSREGANTVWGPCLVRRLQTAGDTVEERLFGLILERNGRFKFVSLAVKL